MNGGRAAIKKEIENVPQSADAYNQYGIIHFRRKNYTAAIKAIKKAVQLSPNSIQFRENLGTFYAVSQQYDSARTTFNDILELNPQHRGARQALKRLKRLSGK